MFDAIEPAIDVIEPLLNGGVIQLDTRDLALEGTEPRHNFVELAIDAVETIIQPRETDAQKVENVAGFIHIASSTTPIPACQLETAMPLTRQRPVGRVAGVSFDDLVGAGEDHLRNRQSERLRSL
jgi:hypothetical protein